jgi:predicted anti-sigma-YlaC factor YlaD
MNCHAAQRLLSAERDGALASSERASLDAHVAECGECRQMRTAIAAAVESLRAASAQIAVPDADRAWQDIRRAIRTTAPAGSRERGAFPRWTLPLTVAAALALAATLAPRWLGNPVPTNTARLEVARADFVETATNTSSMVYVDDKSGWLVVWAVDDKDKM